MSQTLTVGESFAIMDDDAGKELTDVRRISCDQVAVAMGETCWTIEISKSASSLSLWSRSKARTVDVVAVGNHG